MSLKGRINRIARLLCQGKLWNGESLLYTLTDRPNDQLSPGALRFRIAVGLHTAVCLLAHRDQSDESRQDAAEALGVDAAEELDAETLRQRALAMAEQEGLTEAERHWLDSLMSSRPEYA
jgi:hypothetical protein